VWKLGIYGDIGVTFWGGGPQSGFAKGVDQDRELDRFSQNHILSGGECFGLSVV
jgi:hypothetical protein